MKNSFYLLIIVFCCNSSWSQHNSKGLIAYYPFDNDPADNNSKNIKDASLYQNNGVYVGNVRYVPDRHNVDCRALAFDGSSYISIPNSVSLSSPNTQFTASVWVNIADGSDFFRQWLTILCKSDALLEKRNSPHYRMQATAQTVSINTLFTENFTPQLSYDTWYFYAYTFDGSQVKVYIDGRLVYKYSYRYKLYPNTMPLEIGRDLPGATEYFYGIMDELRIYNRALNENELYDLYKDDSGKGQVDACPAVFTSTIASNTQTPNSDDETIVIDINDPIYNDSSTIIQDTVIKFKDIPSTPVSTPQDSIYSDLPDTIDDLPVNYQNTITVKNKNIRIYPYDNEKEDGDIVSININGVWVKDRFTIRTKKRSPLASDYIRVSLNQGTYNYIISRAWNVGRISPNTLTIEIDDGVSVQEVMINADVGISGGIRIIMDDK